jgi:organic radical activating enzyme
MNYARLDHADPSNKNTVVINWCLGNTCNFSCSYCPTNLHDSSVPWISYDQVVSFIDQINFHYKRKLRKQVYFEFTGGEVTLWKEMPNLLRYMNEKKLIVGIISNGSRTIRWWEENKHLLHHVCLSFHPEQCDSEHFVQVAALLSETLRLHINIMMLPEKFDQCMQLADAIYEKVPNITIALEPLLHDFGSELFAYSDEQKVLLKEKLYPVKQTKNFPHFRGAMIKTNFDGSKETVTAPQLISQRENNWSGWRCSIGVDQLVVDYHGRIFKGWCKEDGIIGQVTDRQISFPWRPVLCTRNHCHCVLDVMNTKERV